MQSMISWQIDCNWNAVRNWVNDTQEGIEGGARQTKNVRCILII